MDTKAVFVVWQDPDSRRWIPVAQLTREHGTFRFKYTQGALESRKFMPFGSMTDLKSTYESSELFPLFANRILPKSRPEYREYIKWLGLDPEYADDLDVLARSGGVRATDTLEIVPCPQPKDEQYVAHFFIHGLRHLSSKDQERARGLVPGERLFVMRDVQNKVDLTALILRTEDPISVVGYCPRYFSAEFSQLFDRVGPERISTFVERTSPEAPSHFRVLCRLVAPWPKNFQPCALDEFQPLGATTTIT
jgi:hypothetical protein